MGTLSAKHFCIAILSSSAMFTGLCALPADAQGTHATDTKQYSPVEITNLNPEEILPIVWQVEFWDREAYKHIEHLRIAEATKIRDMMRKYGAWDSSAEEFQALMGRIHVGMTFEEPMWYDNYELIWWGATYQQPSNHATNERHILNSIIDKANFIVQNWWNPRRDGVYKLVNTNPNNIYIFWNSNYWYSDKIRRLSQNSENFKKNLARLRNFLIFAAWGNIGIKKWILKNKAYHWDINWDESGEYSLHSMANWAKNEDPSNHVMVTVWTNKMGDVNQTGRKNGSKFQVWANGNSLFSGRSFPHHNNDNWWSIVADPWNYTTSYPNYLNVAMSGLCAQNFADIDDVDELLEMMRSTADTDYIRLDLNWDWDTEDVVRFDTDDGSYINQPESQPLQLINPGEVFRTYGMAINETEGKRPSIQMPAEIASGQVSSLEKGWYKGVVFLFPGTEVLVDGEWTPFDNEHFNATIKNCNPFHLEYRMNGDLLVQQGFKVGDAIEGTIQAVDDQWWGLKDISKPFTLTLTDNPDSIGTLAAGNQSTKSSWYTISGQKLSKRPTKPGIYIHKGKKVVIQ